MRLTAGTGAQGSAAQPTREDASRARANLVLRLDPARRSGHVAPMLDVRLGVILFETSLLRVARADDPVQLVLLRSTLVDPPRAAGARSLRDTLSAAHADAEVIPYVWHYVSHIASDGLAKLGTRSLAGARHGFGHLQDTPEVRAALDTTLQAAEQLGATRVALRTPPSFSPSPAHRGRLSAFVALVRERGFDLVWEPEGLWSDPVLMELSDELELPVLVSALSATGRAEATDPTWAWLRVDPQAADLRPANADALLAHVEDVIEELGLEDATEQAEGEEAEALSGWRPTVVCAGPRAYANVRVLARELESR